MSRVGLKAITIPAGATVTVGADKRAVIKGKLGELVFAIPDGITVTVTGNTINVLRASDIRDMKMKHGTVRSIINSMIIGVTTGFTKELELVGVGYRAAMDGKDLSLAIGFKHLVKVVIPSYVQVEVPSQTSIKITGIDKQLVGAFAAALRIMRPPEPYKGKGIRYLGEIVRKKVVKTAVA